MEETIGGVLGLLLILFIIGSFLFYFIKMRCEHCHKKISKHYHNDSRLCNSCYLKISQEEEEEREKQENLLKAKEKYAMKR